MKAGLLTVSAVALASLLAACANGAGRTTAVPLNPGSRYPIEARAMTQEIALAQRADGLSPAQRAALADVAMRAQGRPIVVRAPAGGDPTAVRSAFNAKAHLEGMGYPAVRMAAYDAPDGGAPILVGFTAYEAVIPQCGTSWENLSASGSNQTQSNFGCAVNANMAAQIADPGDIVSPEPLDPTDAQRRMVVLGKYRAGEVTSAARDPLASGQVAEVVP